MEETKDKPNEYLDGNGYFKEGNPGGGRPKDTEEVKLLRKATKQIIAEYKEALSNALPMIEPIIIAKALEGDMIAIKEIHDRTMDKSKQPTEITGDVTITQGVVMLPQKDARLETTTNTTESLS